MTRAGLVRGRYVVTGTAADGALSVLPDAAVLHEDGVVVEVGDFGKLAARYPDIATVGSDQTLVMPGLVNAHHHVGVTPLQLGSLDYPLELWLVTRLGARPVSPYLDTLYSAFELIEAGVTTVQHIQGRILDPANEGQERIQMVLKAYADVGMRVSFCVNLRDQNRLVYEADRAFLARLPSPIRDELAPVLEAQDISLADQLTWFFREPLAAADGNRAARVRVQLAPANLHWCSDEALTEIARCAVGADVPMHMHLLETPYQLEYGRRRTPAGAVSHLAELGVLGPALTLGHGVWLSDADVDLLADTGTRICHNPSSNLRLKSGVAPVNALLRKHVPVALGIDEAGLNDDRDMFLEMRLALNLHRPPGLDRNSPSAADVFRMATEQGACTTGFAGQVGRLAPGYSADLVVMDWDQIARPYLDEDIPIIDALVRRGKTSGVRTVIVDGEVILDNGRFTKVDRDAAIGQLEAELGRPLPPETQRLRRMSKAILPYVQGLYADWPVADAMTHVAQS